MKNRYLNPEDIYLPPGYSIEVFAQGLNTPSGLLFTSAGDLLIADTGYITGNPVIYRYVDNEFIVLADGFHVPLLGITEFEDKIYVAHRATVTIIYPNGTRSDIITGLPSYGDYSNSKVAFGPNGKMYFGQGTATNSGVVGIDNLWINQHPFFHDYPGSYIMINGQNFETPNILLPNVEDVTLTGAFSPFSVSNLSFETRKGHIRASGGILRSNPDGSDLELVAWGFRSPSYLKFDEAERLFVANTGYDVRGSRPIANAPDEFQFVTPGLWYGWPDYAAGEPVTASVFTPEGGIQPEFLLVSHPNIPPKPFAMFPPNATIIGFDFNYNTNFGPYGDVYIAEFGSVRPRTILDIDGSYHGVGHRVSRIDMSTGEVNTFAINKSGFPSYLTREGGLNRPSDVVFGPDGAMYVVDMGLNTVETPNVFLPNTGVIWRITRTTERVYHQYPRKHIASNNLS
ncbi:hypothetical protein I5677_08595 [Mobilitalea sibirica]|uniref:Sugar lactone lactonase YvrE n=2 Tax=Mobilitalea sibirica TaxID=1462919 RepID=A0A8J7KWV4_9FIRM|nr:hypothetical protein [Mobilitalea sibirica]